MILLTFFAKRTLLLILSLWLCVTGFAQTNTVSLPLDKRSDVSEIVSLGDRGFVVKTAIAYAGREKNIQIHSFTNSMEKRWTVKLDKPTNTLLHYTLLASPYSSYTYYIQMSKVFNGSKGTIYITRIDSLGKTKEIEYKVPREFDGAGRVAMFADDDALYFLNYEEKLNKDRDIKKKKAENKKESSLVVYVLSAGKTEMERHETDVKMTSESQTADLFVEYLGHDEDYIYLSRKSIDVTENAVKYEVFTLDKSFATLDISAFEAKIDDPLVPSLNSRNYNGAEIYNNDYDTKVTQRGNKTVITYTPNGGSYGCAYLDVASGSFYMYGLTGTRSSEDSHKESDGADIGPSGAYICKFDFNTGDLLEQKEFDLPREMLADMSFATYSFMNRSIWMDVVDEETFRFCGVGSGEDIHVSIVPVGDKKVVYAGKKIGYRKYSGTYHRRFLANALGSKVYLNDAYFNFANQYPDFRTNDYSIFAIFLGDRTIVVRNSAFTKDPRLEFTMFKHKGTE